MFRVYLCDDIPVQLMMVEDIVRECCKDREIRADIVSFGSGEQLLSYIDENGGADLYILDIIMPGIKGIALGEVLRARGDKGRIVFLTASADYAVDSYRVNAFYYILKPIGRQKIMEVLDKVFKDCKAEAIDRDVDDSDDFIQIKSHEGRLSIRSSQLCYVDIVNRCPCYHLLDGRDIEGTTIRGTFAQAVTDICKSRSMRIIGSHLLINIAAIDRVECGTVYFKNGTEYYPSKTAMTKISGYLV